VKGYREPMMGKGRALAATGIVIALAAALISSWLIPADRAHAQVSCTGDTSTAGLPKLPGPRLRFGITPSGEAGALGPPVPPVPDDPAKTLAALDRLRPARAPITLRLNRFFWSLGEQGFQQYLALTRHYTNAGYLVELQLRYHPTPEQVGNIAAWTSFVRRVVRVFGRNRRVTGIQVTNEVNFPPIAPDASDSFYPGARDALVRGVIAAKKEALRDRYAQLRIGFNWAYRNTPANEESFWDYLRDTGGRTFVRSVDWVGLDAYPGTFLPPAAPGGEGEGLITAISELRRCYMPIAGLGTTVPIRIEENGWPTDTGRSEAQQEQALRSMVAAASDFRGTYHVTDYRWFDLRDHRTSAPNFQYHYGLLRDDYSEKPAFSAYRELIDALAARRPRDKPKVRMKLRFRRGSAPNEGRCARSRIKLVFAGRDAGAIYSARFKVGNRSAGSDDEAPIRGRIPLRFLSTNHSKRIEATIELADRRRARLGRRLRRC